MIAGEFDLLLFHRDLQTSCRYLEAGVDGIVIDLETVDKAERQRGYDTEINEHSLKDLRTLRAGTARHLLCRVSSPTAGEAEIAAVIEAGADEIIVPMLTSAQQGERICQLTHDACSLTLMVETVAAASAIREISALPAARIYIGLNDLCIARQTASIFTPLSDGLLERLRRATTGPAFGFGGLTLPGLGRPLPVAHLYNEMARLDAGFTFLRRSFYRDTKWIAPRAALARIRSGLSAAQQRSASRVEADRLAMVASVESLLALPRYG